ncbi:hypothetical protein CLOAM0146 [Candidatus Cloacimonas acidaminovorans str. Evry]|uniref:Uncharacterized protein n=1 Tax=Cloacimonas acidaminovorans (strain Evry) TaxID=459349 RepID=B0VIZ6_CLOAI|nr:hypothetical protein CLOAM0146 [Candidatus Cloacimonas acidaminovorans str. Evry]
MFHYNIYIAYLDFYRIYSVPFIQFLGATIFIYKLLYYLKLIRI